MTASLSDAASRPPTVPWRHSRHGLTTALPSSTVRPAEVIGGDATGPGDPDPDPARVEARLPVAALRAGDSPRLAGVDEAHARLLASTEADLPPILVHRRTMQVVDGAHRLRAATLRGDPEIRARYVDGDEAETFVRAVTANLAHGLPLSRADREAAAVRIVALRPQWSDRAVAAASGLPRSAVRRLRERSTGPASRSNARLGRDGRVRPVEAIAGRLAASRVLDERPDASVRDVARAAGVSLGTAHDVRARVRRGEDPVPAGLRRQASAPGSAPGSTRPQVAAAGTASPVTASPGAVRLRARPRRRGAGTEAARGPSHLDPAGTLRRLRRDPAVRQSQRGRLLLWLLAVAAEEPGSWRELARAVPPHRARSVADLARLCARRWDELADLLEDAGSQDAGSQDS